MRIIFFGTPEFVMPVVNGLYKEYRTVKEKGVVAVVTQRPKPAGRKKHVEYSPVDKWGYKRSIPVFYDFAALPEADLGVVAAYGKIIPKNVISHFKHGILNIHPSLLPRYRGASPTQAAIINGDAETGVTIIKMDEMMDHGPIVSKFTEKIREADNNEELRSRLFERSAQFLVELIPGYLAGKIKPKEQNHAEATFTKLVSKEDGFIKEPFAEPVKTERLFRAYQPWPGIFTKVIINNEDKRLKILSLHLENEKLILDTVQLEGKNPVSWEEFEKGYPNFRWSSATPKETRA